VIKIDTDNYLPLLNSLNISTSPKLMTLWNGKVGVAWRATRLAFKRKGIALLKNPDDLIIIEISPNSSKEGYEPGYFVISLKDFRECFQNVIYSDSFKGKIGVYNPPVPPDSMNPYFIRK
jgi:hypothetical protein